MNRMDMHIQLITNLKHHSEMLTSAPINTTFIALVGYSELNRNLFLLTFSWMTITVKARNLIIKKHDLLDQLCFWNNAYFFSFG